MNTADTNTPILYDVSDGVATITLNRPEKINAFNQPMLDAWVAHLVEAQTDDAVRAIVITGSGKGFCSGGDVDKMGGSDDLTPLRIKEGLRQGVQRIPEQLARMDKPVIAAINGSAVGAGLDLALACDIRFAAAGARLSESYVRVGLVPGAGGAWLLPRIVGTAKALELLWSSEFIDANEALRLGIVNQIYADDELLPRTQEFAQRLAAAPPMSIRLIKRAVYQGLEMNLTTALDLISSHQTLVRNSADHAEAVAALREKRPGIYHGR